MSTHLHPARQDAASFAGEVAVVTGASRGIGFEVTRGWIEGGGTVVMVSRRRGSLSRAARELVAQAGPAATERVAWFLADVSSDVQVRALARWAARRHARVDALVNNAGRLDLASFDRLTDAVWRRSLETNLLGPVRVLRAFLPLLRRSRRARVVNVSSVAGVEGSDKIAGTAAYAAAKAGLIALTQVVDAEWRSGPRAAAAPRLNAVSFGSVDTAMLRAVARSAGTGMPPAVAARAVLYLASRASEPIHGQNLRVLP